MAHFDIVLKTRASLYPSGEPEEDISEYEGIITCTNDETGEGKPVGRVVGQKVHASLAADHGENLFAICDSHSQEFHQLHSLLYEPEGYGFRDALVERFDAVEWDLLVLDYVVLSPKWRGLKLGLLAVRRVVDLLGGGCGLAVSLIYPLRRDAFSLMRVPPSWLPRNPHKPDRRAVAVKLRRYYRRMGFTRLGRTPYYALPMMKRTPTAEDILAPEGGLTTLYCKSEC